jgi:hypothetical protein
MSVVDLGALAPPPRRAAPKLSVDPDVIALAVVLDVLRKTQPATFTQLSEALHGLLDKEGKLLVRVPHNLLPTSQGRAQIADDVLGALDNCALLAERARNIKVVQQK